MSARLEALEARFERVLAVLEHSKATIELRVGEPDHGSGLFELLVHSTLEVRESPLRPLVEACEPFDDEPNLAFEPFRDDVEVSLDVSDFRAESLRNDVEVPLDAGNFRAEAIRRGVEVSLDL